MDTEVKIIIGIKQVQYMNKHVGDVTYSAAGAHTVAFILECKGVRLDSILEPRPFLFHF